VRVEGPFAGKLATGRSVELYYVYHGLNVTNEYDRWGQVAANYDFGLPGGLTVPAQWQLLGNRLHSGIGGVSSAGSVDESGAWRPDFGPPGDLVRATFSTEGERYYFHDALGSTTMLAGSPAPGSPPTIAARYDYDPWGTQLNTPQSGVNRVNFTTYRHDAETGLEYAMARHYSPKSGRFIQKDVLWVWSFGSRVHTASNRPSETFAGGAGRQMLPDLRIPLAALPGFGEPVPRDCSAAGNYGYASNSPTRFADPSGWYGVDVHMGLTDYLARSAGFSDEDARRLGELNQGMDLGENSPVKCFLYYVFAYNKADWYERLRQAMDPHFPIGPEDSSVVANSTYVNSRIDKTIEEGNFVEFGKELHRYQDSWSHAEFHFNHGLSKKPDKTFIRDRWKTSGRDIEMARAVYSKIEAFLDNNEEYRAHATEPFPEKFMIDYLRLKSNKEKEMALRRAGCSEYGPHYEYQVVQMPEGSVAVRTTSWRFERFEEPF